MIFFHELRGLEANFFVNKDLNKLFVNFRLRDAKIERVFLYKIKKTAKRNTLNIRNIGGEFYR